MDVFASFFQMNSAGGQLDDLFRTVLNLSVTGAVVICAVLLLRLALKRAPKKYSYWLWAAAGFRLLCPVSWRSVFSIFSLSPVAGSLGAPAGSSGAVDSLQYIPADIALAAQPAVTLPVPQLSAAVNRVLPAASPMSSANPVQIWLYLGALLWLAGVAAMLLWGIWSCLRLRRRLRTAVRLEANVWQSELVGSPFLLGFLWPRIYLPYGLEGERLACVLAHERFHLARRDHLVKLLGFLILCVHWFNPLVWLGFSRMGRDMEMRCDEAVLGRSGGSSRAYSETLLSFAVGARFPSPGPLAFGESGVKARIRNALKWRKPRTWVTVTALLLAAAGIAACTANPAQPKAEETGTPWDWTQTVQAVGLAGTVCDRSEATAQERPLSELELQALCQTLRAVPKEAVYPGRGYPSQKWVTLTDGTAHYTLSFGGESVVLAFDDETAKQWPIDPENPAPSWEIHDQALLNWLDGLSLDPPEAAELFSDELRTEIVEKWKTHQPTDATLPGSVSRYFDSWAEATAWAGWTPENPLEAERVWLTPKNTAGADVVLYGQTDHAAVQARGDAAGAALSLSVEAGYACTWENVRVQYRAEWGVDATAGGGDSLSLRDGVTGVLTEDAGEGYLARELRYARNGAGYAIRLISLDRDAEALDRATARLLNLCLAPPEVRISPELAEPGNLPVLAQEQTPQGANITVNLDIQPLRWAQELTAEAAAEQDRNGREAPLPYRIVDAELVGLTRMETGTAALDCDISIYRVEYRLYADTPERVVPAGGLRLDGDAITEYGSMGQPYLVLYHDGGGWTRLAQLTEPANQPEFAGEEALERYGNPYTAACMLCYERYWLPDTRLGEGEPLRLCLLSEGQELGAADSPWDAPEAAATAQALNALRWELTRELWVDRDPSDDVGDLTLPTLCRDALRLETADWTLTAYAGTDAVLWEGGLYRLRSRWLRPAEGREGERLVYELLRGWYEAAQGDE